MIRWRTASVCKHTHPCTHTHTHAHKGPCDLHNRLVSLASGGVWSASVFPTLPPLQSCRRSSGPDNGGKAELFIKDGGLHWERGTSRELGRILMADTTFGSLKPRMLQLLALIPASPFIKPPNQITRGTACRFCQGLRLGGEAEGRPMLFGKLHCVCVKAKEQHQDTVTSTITWSFAFLKSFFFVVYQDFRL